MENLQGLVVSEALSKVLEYLGANVLSKVPHLSGAPGTVVLLGGTIILGATIDSVCRNGYQLRIKVGDFEVELFNARDNTMASQPEVIDVV